MVFVGGPTDRWPLPEVFGALNYQQNAYHNFLRLRSAVSFFFYFG